MGTRHSPPLPRRLDRPRPDPALGVPRGLLSANVVRGVASVGHRPALTDQPLLDVSTANVAVSNNTAKAVGVDWLAGDRRVADKIGQCQRTLLPAAPRGAVRLKAFLALLGSVDAAEPDTLAMDFNGITVDD